MRDLLAGMLCQLKAERNHLQIESPFHISRNKKVCETISLTDNGLSKIHEAEVDVFSHSALCLGKSAMTKTKSI